MMNDPDCYGAHGDVRANEGLEAGFAGCVTRLASLMDSRMTVREVVATAYLAGRTDSLDALRAVAAPAASVGTRLAERDDAAFSRGYATGAGMVLTYADGLRAAAIKAADHGFAGCVASHPSMSARGR